LKRHLWCTQEHERNRFRKKNLKSKISWHCPFNRTLKVMWARIEWIKHTAGCSHQQFIV
jgi:hypothetical protein